MGELLDSSSADFLLRTRFIVSAQTGMHPEFSQLRDLGIDGGLIMEKPSLYGCRSECYFQIIYFLQGKMCGFLGNNILSLS